MTRRQSKYITILLWVGIFSLFAGCGNQGSLSIQASSHSNSERVVAMNSESTTASSLTCDGSTDNTAVIQSMIDESVGGNLVIPAQGAACVVSGLTIPSNSHVTINAYLLLGPNSNTSGSTNSILTVNNANNVIIDGSGTLDGNRSNQDGSCCSAGINAANGTNLSIQGLTVQNVKNWPVNIVEWNGAQMSNLTLLNSGNSVEFAAETTNCSASGLRISGINDEGFAFYGGVSNCSLSNSVISNSSASGVSVLNDSAQSAPSNNITIENIESFDNALSGVEVNTGIGGVGSSSNITITGSRLHGNGGTPINNATGTNVMESNNTTSGGSQPLTTISGNIDGVVSNGNGSYSINGWACTLFDPESIPVDLYLNAPAGSAGAIGIARFHATNTSEAAVAAACQSSGSAYRFSIQLSASIIQQYQGKSIYLHGISPWGFANDLLTNSGTFTVPLVSPTDAPATQTLYREFDASIGFHMSTDFEGEAVPAYQVDGPLLQIYQTQASASFVQLYRCRFGSGHFSTTSSTCEGASGAAPDGPLGWVDSVQKSGEIPLYRLFNPANGDHMDSTDASEGAADGYHAEGILGYALP
jgi:hypothetical protein